MDMKQISFLLMAVALLCSAGMANGQESEFFKAEKIKAEQGNALAQVLLGGMYAKGQGVPENYVESYAWYLLAKANGDEEASEAISNLEKDLTAEQIEKGKAQAAALRRLIEERKETQEPSVESP